MASVWPPENSGVYDQTPNTSETVYEALLSLKLLIVLSKQ